MRLTLHWQTEMATIKMLHLFSTSPQTGVVEGHRIHLRSGVSGSSTAWLAQASLLAWGVCSAAGRGVDPIRATLPALQVPSRLAIHLLLQLLLPQHLLHLAASISPPL